MKTFNRQGEVLHYIPKAGDNIKSGDLVAVEDVVGVAVTDGIVGELLAVSVQGVYLVPVPAALGQIKQGQSVYFDSGAKEITLTDTDLFVGWAWEDGEPGEVVPVKIAY